MSCFKSLAPGQTSAAPGHVQVLSYGASKKYIMLPPHMGLRPRTHTLNESHFAAQNYQPKSAAQSCWQAKCFVLLKYETRAQETTTALLQHGRHLYSLWP